MKQYLELLDYILQNGEDRGDRTGTGVISSFGHQIRFDLKDGFPAVTTKSLAWKGVVSELLWFLEGSDDERRLAEIRFQKDRSELTDLSKFSTIWTDNADNQGVELGYENNEVTKKLGPVYGVQWRNFNGEDQEGVGYYQTTQKNGKRCSAAKAYLVPALDRDNLTILTDTNVNKINISEGKATGVQCIDQEGNEFTVNASKEVLLSSGAFGSPQILLRSGIGPSEEITKHGIDHKIDLPGVGKNLQDHIDFITVHKHKSINLLGFSLGTLFFKYPYELLKYILAKTGMFTSTVAEAGGFVRSRNDVDVPDIQLHFAPAMVIDHGRTSVWGHGLSCHVCLLRPKSRGEVTLKSADPFEDPLIDPKFLSHPDDVSDLVAGYKKMMSILNKDPVGKYTSNHTQRPINIDDDKDIEQAIREDADTVYHPVGTCKMGYDDMAVVDNKLKVHGIDGLRVVDASIMPTLIGGNTNAPTIMIGEKASDMILQDWASA